jgi:hypothetical protein
MKPFPLCLSPSKFGGGDNFKSNFGHVAEVTRRAVGGVRVMATNNRKVMFSVASTWVFFASWLASFASSSTSQDSGSRSGSDFQSGKGPCSQKVMKQVKRGILVG